MSLSPPTVVTRYTGPVSPDGSPALKSRTRSRTTTPGSGSKAAKHSVKGEKDEYGNPIPMAAGFSDISVLRILTNPYTIVYGALSVLCTIFTYFIANYFVPMTQPEPKLLPFLVGYFIFEIILSVCLPGERYYGPPDAIGFVPRYKNNAVSSLILSLAAYLGLVYLDVIPGDLLYRNLGQLAYYMAIVSVIVCVGLWIKARTNPNSATNLTGDPLEEIFVGSESYPYIMDINVKHLCNCRIGMMLWPLVLTSTMFREQGISNPMLVSYGLQMFYLLKFYYWEPGYMNSLDIILDYAGQYVVGGCLAYVPIVYTSPLWLLGVKFEGEMSNMYAVGVATCGIIAITLNYLADLDKQIFRESNGERHLFGEKPNYIQTSYKGRRLLTSGFWGVARHINYVFELSLALAWSCPHPGTYFGTYYYFAFLCILLVHRNTRDYERCFAQYGADWLEYCKKVPYGMIPYVY